MSFSFSVYKDFEQRVDQEELDPLPGQVSLSSADLDWLSREVGISILHGMLTPSALEDFSRRLKGAIDVVEKGHKCNCAYCGWKKPDIYFNINAYRYRQLADFFEAVAERGWAIKGGF